VTKRGRYIVLLVTATVAVAALGASAAVAATGDAARAWGIQLALPDGWSKVAPASDSRTDPRTMLVIGTDGVRATQSDCQVSSYRVPADGAAVVVIGWKTSIGVSFPPLSAMKLRAATPDDLDALYDIASRLCNESQFQHALPIALHLETHAQSPRHGFIAATCLQRLNQPELAAPMYALCLVGNPRHVAAMFRLGECLAATGREEEAVQAFEATIDLGRADAAFVELQELARRRIDQLAARRIRN
jgi:tetratricopeptide (TPR) repeat protein